MLNEEFTEGQTCHQIIPVPSCDCRWSLVLGKDRVSSAHLPGGLQEGFPEEVTFELSLTRQVRVFKTSKSFLAKPGWKLISGRRHNVTCSLAVKGHSLFWG